MQPTYLPWLGYYAMIANVDLFVFLDTPQFAYRSWQQRNRILRNGRPSWLTVPVNRPNGRETLLNEVLLDPQSNFEPRHVDIVREAYGSQPQAGLWLEWLSSHLSSGHTHLASLTADLILSSMQILNVRTPVAFASDLKVNGSSAQRLLEIMISVKGSTYVAAPGSRDYLLRFNGFEESGVALEYFSYEHPIYEQGGGSFESHLSFIDAAVRMTPSDMALLLDPSQAHDTSIS